MSLAAAIEHLDMLLESLRLLQAQQPNRIMSIGIDHLHTGTLWLKEAQAQQDVVIHESFKD